MTLQPYFKGELEAAVIHPRRLSEPDEVASAVVFLIENSMMNDSHIRVDGGWRGSSNWGGAKDRECIQTRTLIDNQLDPTPSLWNRSENTPGFSISYLTCWYIIQSSMHFFSVELIIHNNFHRGGVY